MGDGLPPDLVQLRSTLPIRALVLLSSLFAVLCHWLLSCALARCLHVYTWCVHLLHMHSNLTHIYLSITSTTTYSILLPLLLLLLLLLLLMKCKNLADPAAVAPGIRCNTKDTTPARNGFSPRLTEIAAQNAERPVYGKKISTESTQRHFRRGCRLLTKSPSLTFFSGCWLSCLRLLRVDGPYYNNVLNKLRTYTHTAVISKISPKLCSSLQAAFGTTTVLQSRLLLGVCPHGSATALGTTTSYI